MGKRMARRLVAAGYDLTVWSRSGVPADAPDLRERARPTVREAVRGAAIAIAMVEDDEASRRVWLDPEDGALAELAPGSLAIDSSTISPDFAAAVSTRATAARVAFLDAPVVGSRPQAEAGALVFLVGGAESDVARARPLLLAMGSAVHELGPTPHGARAKLAVNTLFSAQVALLGELLAANAVAGLAPMRLMDVLSVLPVTSPAAKLAGAAICAQHFVPQFPIALVAKDLRYAVAAASSVGARVPVTSALAEIFAQAKATGLARENITAVSKLYPHSLGKKE